MQNRDVLGMYARNASEERHAEDPNMAPRCPQDMYVAEQRHSRPAEHRVVYIPKQPTPTHPKCGEA